MYMLDTNIIIFCIRHLHSECAEKLAEHIGTDVCISVITYADLEYGIENSSDPVRNREAVHRFLAGILIYKEQAKAHNWQFFDASTVAEASDRDKLHMEAKDHRALAEAIHRMIRE